MKDFFISYNKADRSWAEWIAWTLEEAGYTVVVQAWDFRPGSNFVLEMERATDDAERTIAVLSEDYLNAAFTQSEWAAAFAQDPQGQERSLIPVKVKECNPEGLLKAIVYIDLVGLTESEARVALLGAFRGRAKPPHAPDFPADIRHSRTFQPQFPRAQDEISLFFSYSHKDENLRDELTKHLSLLKRQNIITAWYDRQIIPGSDWEQEIDKHLNSSQIILLLISSDFLASDYCYGKEMLRAMEMHQSGAARVIPIILRACDWHTAPFGKLQALPRGARAVTSWPDLDEAFTSIAQGIRLACRELSGDFSAQEIESQPRIIPKNDASVAYNLVDVFKYPGVPDITFVEPDNFYFLKMSLKQPGLGVVIEGPSGIGKTTALRKAAEQLKLSSQLDTLEILTARRLEDIQRIRYIEQWHKGTLAIDDFHRLEADLRNHVTDYLKYLADRESPAKLIVIGIPGTGKRLVEISFDLGTRIRSFKLGKVKDEIVLSMINKGEVALNITFDRKAEIVLAASGSLNIAQILCSNLVAQTGIDKTQNVTKIIHCDLESATAEVMEQLAPKFDDVIHCFASLDGHMDKTCIGLLEELGQADNGFLSLPRLKDRRYDLAAGIDRFVTENYIVKLGERFPSFENCLYYDQKSQALIIDDPQLRFYLLRTPASILAHEAGKY
jgi:hypothetical protein